MAAQFTATTASVEALFLLLDCSYSLSRGLVFITLLSVEDYFSTVLLQLQPEWKPMFYYFTAATASENPIFLTSLQLQPCKGPFCYYFTAITALAEAYFSPPCPEQRYAEVSNFMAGAKVGNLALQRDLSFTRSYFFTTLLQLHP